MKDEPNRAPAKAAIAPGQRPGVVVCGEKRGGDTRKHPKSMERPPRGLSGVDPTLVPITDRVWGSRNRLAAYKEAASHVGKKDGKRAALALHEFSEGLKELRDELDAAGWNIVARWVHQAASSLNIAARFAWLRGDCNE